MGEDTRVRYLTKPVGTDPNIVKLYRRDNMVRNGLHGSNTACATIRDIYLKTDDDEIKLWCRIAMRMTKEMWKTLVKYDQILKENGIESGIDMKDWQGHLYFNKKET